MHGKTAAFIGAGSFIIFMISTLMCAFTSYNSEKEIAIALREPIAEIFPEDWKVIRKYIDQYGKEEFLKMYDQMRVKDSIMEFLVQYPNRSFSITEIKEKIRMHTVDKDTLLNILFELIMERKIETALIKDELYIIYKPM